MLDDGGRRLAVSFAMVLAGQTVEDRDARPPESLESFTAEEIYKRGEYELENSRKPQDAVTAAKAALAKMSPEERAAFLASLA